jgi:hypothetical protein
LSSQNKKNRRKNARIVDQARQTEETPNRFTRSWITMSKGVRVITVMSLSLGLWTSYNTVRALGWAEGLMWGFIFGGSIWLVFFLVLSVNRVFRRRPPQ